MNFTFAEQVANDEFPVAPFIAPIDAGNHGNLSAWLAAARDDQRHGVDTTALQDALIEGFRASRALPPLSLEQETI